MWRGHKKFLNMHENFGSHIKNVIALDTKWMTNDATAFLKNNFTNWSQGAF